MSVDGNMYYWAWWFFYKSFPIYHKILVFDLCYPFEIDPSILAKSRYKWKKLFITCYSLGVSALVDVILTNNTHTINTLSALRPTWVMLTTVSSVNQYTDKVTSHQYIAYTMSIADSNIERNTHHVHCKRPFKVKLILPIYEKEGSSNVCVLHRTNEWVKSRSHSYYSMLTDILTIHQATLKLTHRYFLWQRRVSPFTLDDNLRWII